MSINYINIGENCSFFSEASSAPTTLTLQDVYLIDGATGQPLKNTPSPTTSTGYLRSPFSSSNNFNFSEALFKVWFDENLVRFASGRQNWRYLTDGAASAKPSYDEIGNTRFQVVIGSLEWPTQTNFNEYTGSAGFSVTHPAGGTTYVAVNSSNVLMNTYVFSSIVNFPSIISYSAEGAIPAASVSGISVDNNPVMYLYNKANSASYLVFGSGAFTVTTTNLITAVTPTGFYVTRIRNGNTNVTFALATGTVGSLTRVVSETQPYYINANYEVVITAGAGAGTYRFTTTNPPLGETPAGFPDTSSTLFKHKATGRYLYWNGTGFNSAISTNFTLEDYWKSGLSSIQIIQGMQFKFQDMTGTSNAAAGGDTTIKDWYQWKVVNNVTNAPTITNTSNVAVNKNNVWWLGSSTQFGNQATSTDAHPSIFEGWSIIAPSGGTSDTALVYVRVPTTGGVATPVGYLTANPNPTFVASSTLPNVSGAGNSNVWSCIKCTSAAGQYCSPLVSGGTVSTKILTTGISVLVVTTKQLTVTVSGSTLTGTDAIAFRLSTGSNMSGTIVNLSSPPTAWNQGSAGVFTLNTSADLTSGSPYTIEVSSSAPFVVGSPTIFQFIVPIVSKALGIISSVTVKTTTTFDITVTNSGLTTGDVVNLRFSRGNYFVVGAGEVSVGQGISSPSDGLYTWTTGTTATIPVTLSSSMPSATGHIVEISAPNVAGITGSPNTRNFTSLTLKALDLVAPGIPANNQINVTFGSTSGLVTGDTVTIRVFRGASVAAGTLITGTNPSSTTVTKSGAFVAAVLVTLPSAMTTGQYTYELSHTYTHPSSGFPVTIVDSRTFNYP